MIDKVCYELPDTVTDLTITLSDVRTEVPFVVQQARLPNLRHFRLSNGAIHLQDFVHRLPALLTLQTSCIFVPGALLPCQKHEIVYPQKTCMRLILQKLARKALEGHSAPASGEPSILRLMVDLS